MVHPSYQGKGIAKILIARIKKFATENLQANYFLARINTQNIQSIHAFLRQEGAFVGRTEVGNFPDGSQVFGLNVFFPAIPSVIIENFVFLKSISNEGDGFPITHLKDYQKFCSLIKSGYVVCMKSNGIKVCRPYTRARTQIKECVL